MFVIFGYLSSTDLFLFFSFSPIPLVSLLPEIHRFLLLSLVEPVHDDIFPPDKTRKRVIKRQKKSAIL